MATDPTRRIREQESDSPLNVDIREIAERLAAIEPSVQQPFVTVTLDWRIEGTNPGRQPDEKAPGRLEEDRRRSSPRRPDEERSEDSARRRPSRRVFEDELDASIAERDDDAQEALRGELERIAGFLDSEADPSARGYYIVSSAGSDLFEAVPLPLPLPTTVTIAPTPALTELVRLNEDYPSYAALLADQREATLLIIDNGSSERSVELEASDYPRKQQQGGWSQRRFQARADERVDAFARDIAEETRRALEAERIETLVLAGDEVIMSALNDALHESIRERVADTLRLDIDTSPKDLLEATLLVATRVEREREADAVRRMADGIGAGTYGAGGASAVLTALQAGQVETLVMNDDFEGVGWADYTMPAYGAGDLPTQHPLGGDVGNLVAVNLRDELVRLAVLTGAEIEIVHTAPAEDASKGEIRDADDAMPRAEAARALDKHGGVGAVLRYVVGDEPSEEESAAQAQAEDRS